MSSPLDVDTLGLQRTLTWPRSRDDAAASLGERRVDLLGVPVHAVSHAGALQQIERWILAPDRPRLVMTPDTTALMQAQFAHGLRHAYAHADLVTADGTGLVWASRQLGRSLPERVTGIDLLSALCERAAAKQHRVYLLGGRPGVAREAAQRLQRRHPGLAIVGTQHGYFADDESERVVSEINAREPDLLLVGMGVPRQEIWMSRHGHRLASPVAMGVGGSLDVLAGRVRRAPAAWQSLGLEWLWRAVQEPHRLWRARRIPQFIARILRERARVAIDID